MDFPGGSVVKNPPAKQERQIQSLSQEDLRRRKWQPIPVFLPWKCHGQRSLAGYSSWDHQRVGHNVGTKQQQQYMLYSYYIKFELEISDLLMREHRGKCEEKNFLKHLGEGYFFNASYKIKSMNKKNPLKMLASDLKNSGNLSNNVKENKEQAFIGV